MTMMVYKISRARELNASTYFHDFTGICLNKMSNLILVHPPLIINYLYYNVLLLFASYTYFSHIFSYLAL